LVSHRVFRGDFLAVAQQNQGRFLHCFRAPCISLVHPKALVIPARSGVTVLAFKTSLARPFGGPHAGLRCLGDSSGIHAAAPENSKKARSTEFFTVIFYGLKSFCCKTPQVYVTRRER